MNSEEPLQWSNLYLFKEWYEVWRQMVPEGTPTVSCLEQPLLLPFMEGPGILEVQGDVCDQCCICYSSSAGPLQRGKASAALGKYPSVREVLTSLDCPSSAY